MLSDTLTTEGMVLWILMTSSPSNRWYGEINSNNDNFRSFLLNKDQRYGLRV